MVYNAWKGRDPCCAHLLNHVAADAVAQVDSLRRALDCVANVTAFFHRSNVKMAELNEAARGVNVEPRRLVTFSQTRWLGRFPQISTFLHMWWPISAMQPPILL